MRASLIVSTRIVATGIATAVGLALVWKLLRRRSPRVPEHARALAAAIDAMVLASAKGLPVPPLHTNRLPPTEGWLRCTDAMAAVDARPHPSDADADANDQVLVSSCSVDQLSRSRPKTCVDALLATHAKLTFPDLPATLAADPSLVLLLLDAPNVLSTTALAEAFPALRTAALAARVCIPQADPAHYSLMVTEGRMLFNVRFQRLETWLASNAGGGLRVPIFFADYETSVYGRRSMRLSPLQDLQRFLRYGYAGSKCLVGLTLSYRELHRDHYPMGAPVLTHDDVEGFVQHEAACAGMTSELLECYRYGMVFSLFLLTRRDAAPAAAPMPAAPPPTAPPLSRPAAQGTPRLVASAGIRERPNQSRLIHGHEHVTRRWRQLGFVVGGGCVRQALLLTRELLADPEDRSNVTILSINRSEAEIPSFQELRDLERLYPSRVRVAFSLTEGFEGWAGFVGRGDCAMGRAALPSPLCSDADGGRTGALDENRGVMVIVCGKVQGDTADTGTDGFVETWGGAMGKKLSSKGHSKSQRVQGALGGVLQEIGFSADQVFQY